MPVRTFKKYVTSDPFVAAVFLVLAFAGLQWIGDCRAKQWSDLNRQETLTNREIGHRLESRQVEIVERVRAIESRPPATQPGTP